VQLLAQLQVQLRALPWEQPECQGFVFRLFLTFDNGFVVGGLLNFLSLVEVPVMRLGSPGLRPELDNVGVGHLGVGFSEVDVHFPVAAVEVAIVEFKLEGASVPDVTVTLRGGEGVLRPALDDPGSLVLVAVPEHQAARGETPARQLNSLAEVSSLVSDIMGSGPVVSSLSPPLALDSETLRQGVVEGVNYTLGEASKEVHAGVAFPGKSPGKIGEAMLAESLATFAPMVLAVAVTVAITIGGDGLVVEGAAQMPGESLLVGDIAPGPVGINNGGFLVVPVVGVVLSSQVLELPKVAVDGDAGLPELHVLVDVSGVGSTALDLEGNDAPDIDLLVASLGGHPVGGVLAADETLADGALGLEILGDDIHVAGPSTLGTSDMVRGPDVGTILTPPVASHVEGVLVAGVFFVATLDISESVVAESSPDPRAVVEGSALAGGAVDFGDAIHAGGGARGRHKVTVEGAMNIPGVAQSGRHDAW